MSPPDLFRRRTMAAVVAWGLGACALRGHATAATTMYWPLASAVPGGIARLALGPAPVRPRAWSDEVPLLVVPEPTGWTALVGIPLAAEPGDAQIAVEAADGARRPLAYR